MKTMTCKQMGGPCDFTIQGATAEEMMANGAKHLQEVGDDAHKPALQMMADMQNKPEEADRWNKDFEQKFAELPED